VRILFIHEVNYLNKVIFEMHEFPELLALRGHDVSFFHYPESPELPTVSFRTRRERISGRVHRDASINLVTPPTFGGGPLERYAAPFLSIPGLRQEVAHGGYDVIVLYAVPTTGWQTISIARRAGVPVVYRAIDVSHEIRRTPLTRLVRTAERYVSAKADLVSANNPGMAMYCRSLSRRSGPVSVDLPPIDLSHFEVAGPAADRARLGLNDDDRVVVYMGSFFSFSGLDLLLDGLEEQFEAHPSLKLVLVGGGELEQQLRRTVHERGRDDRVLFTGVVPYSELPAYLKIADVAVNPFRSQLVTNVALPHKVLQYMAAGVPAVSTDLRGLHGVLGDDSGVTFVGDVRSIPRVVSELALSDRARLAEISERQRRFVAETFSMAAAAVAFEKRLESVL
jgi:glycosyltransferase involved in cell wall biosynthesis